MQYLTYLLPLAALAAANPLERRGCGNDDCAAAVTGSDCQSFLATTVTPPAITITSTVFGKPSWGAWEKRAQVTECPAEVPDSASDVCDEEGYSSACSCLGFTDVKTTTLAPTTTTKTVYVAPTHAAPTYGGPRNGGPSNGGPGSGGPTSCAAASTVTVTATVTKGGSGSGPTGDSGSTVTVTTTVTKGGSGSGGPSGPTGTPKPDTCLSDSDAKKIVDNFRTLLEYTSYNGTQGRPGRGYQYNVSAITLAPDFVDISDSINFMAGFPLGSVTFANKTSFDYGQGVLQPEVVTETLNIWHGCRDITWRWKVTPQTQSPYPVNGINYMIINEKGLIKKQYAEFDNGAWLQSFPGASCALRPVTVASTVALK